MQKISILSLSFKASSAVAAYRAIGFNGAQATVKGQKVLGVSPRAASSGEMSDVDVVGTTVIEGGGNFVKGDSLIVDTQGRAIKATGLISLRAGATAVASTAANGATVFEGSDLPEYVFADALEDGAQGFLVEVFLRR